MSKTSGSILGDLTAQDRTISETEASEFIKEICPFGSQALIKELNEIYDKYIISTANFRELRGLILMQLTLLQRKLINYRKLLRENPIDNEEIIKTSKLIVEITHVINTLLILTTRQNIDETLG